MNNKPYGWVKNGEYVLYIDKPDSVFNYTPLYTHPVKELTLTDDEILQIWKEFDENDVDNWFIEIVRAILRKAQEK